MDSFNVFFQYLVSFIECFIWWRLMNSVLECKFSKRVPIAAASVMFLLLLIKFEVFSVSSLSQYQTFGTFIIMGYNLIIFLLFFKNSLMEKLIWFGVYYLVIIIMELATVFMLHTVMNKTLDEMTNDHISMYIVLMGKFMLLLLFEVMIRRHKSKLIMGYSYFKELAVIISFNLVLLLEVVYLFTNKNQMVNKIEDVILIIFGAVLLITVYTVILIFRMEKKSKEEIATQLKLQQIELELKLNDDMIHIADRLRKLRHDMNNHIGLIKNLVQMKKYEELEEYINQIYEDVEIANELVITGNKTLSVLLNAKKRLAKAKNIDFTSMIATQEINMKNKDICALLGNILDNAIEAAEKSGNKKYIQLMIQKTEEGCIISCENSLGTKPIMKQGNFVTRKENSFSHGIGTENIKDIVAKYKGEINFDYDDEMFNVRVVMPV